MLLKTNKMLWGTKKRVETGRSGGIEKVDIDELECTQKIEILPESTKKCRYNRILLCYFIYNITYQSILSYFVLIHRGVF